MVIGIGACAPPLFDYSGSVFHGYEISSSCDNLELSGWPFARLRAASSLTYEEAGGVGF